METTLATLATASIVFAGLALVAMVGLTAWRDWIGLKREQLSRPGHAIAPDDYDDARALSGAGSLIEVADLKERIRKLEAIASGVDL